MRTIRPSITCEDAKHLLDLYLDGELDADERREMELHLLECSSCTSCEARRRHTREQLRAAAVVQPTCDEFRARLFGAIDAARCELDEAEAPRVNSGVWQLLPARREASLGRSALPWMAAAAAGVVFASAFALVAARPTSQPAQQADAVLGVTSLRSPLVDEAVAWHGRDVPLDVAGPNRQSVERWFAARVGFAVRVPDLGPRATLLGGRLANVRQHEAAFLLYSVGGEKVTVLMAGRDDLELPDVAERGERLVDTRSGYTVVVAEEDGVASSVTSGLDERELLGLLDAGAGSDSRLTARP